MAAEKIPDKLNRVFEKHGILIAYIFGSQKQRGFDYLSGKRVVVDEASDLDIGLAFEKEPEDVYHIYGSLYAELSRIFKPFRIDIVFMHEVNFLFRFEIISGHRIYAISDDYADDYEEIVTRFASDLSFKKRMFEPDFYEALKNGYFEVELK